MKMLVLLLTLSINLVSQDTISVAILDFDNNAGLDSSAVRGLTSRFQSNLVNSKTYIVIEREKMKELLTEQDFAMSDLCKSDACAVEVGQLIGATHMVSGDITKIGSTYSFNCRLIDVSTGKIIKADSRSHTGSVDGLLTLMDKSALAFTGAKIDVEKQGAVTIPVNVKKEGRIKITIYSITGDKICVLTDSTYSMGKHVIPWDGFKKDGKEAKSGVYLYTIEGEGERKTGKFVLKK